MHTHLLRAVGALLTLCLPALGQQLVTVDDSGGADFTSIQSAVNAVSTQDGATILVEEGFYSGVTVEDASLSIVARPGATVVVGLSAILPAIEVLSTDADQTVSLRGLALVGRLDVNGCLGTVWVEDCTVLAPNADFDLPAARIMGSPSVVLIDTAVQGATSDIPLDPGRVALSVDAASTVTLVGATIEGGRGGCNGGVAIAECTPSGPGLVLDGGAVRALDTTITGGAATPGITDLAGNCLASTQAGEGVIVMGIGSSIWGTDLALAAGNTVGTCTAGADPIVGAAAVVLQDGTPVRLDVTAAVEIGEAFDATVTGAPGELTTLLMSPQALPTWSQGLFGMVLVGAPVLIEPLGPTDGTGTVTRAYAGPWLPPGVDALGVFVQAVQSQGGQVVLGGASRVTALRP